MRQVRGRPELVATLSLLLFVLRRVFKVELLAGISGQSPVSVMHLFPAEKAPDLGKREQLGQVLIPLLVAGLAATLKDAPNHALLQVAKRVLGP